jgi:hypothetical protein
MDGMIHVMSKVSLPILYTSHTLIFNTLNSDHVCNLNHRIDLRFRENTTSTSTFNIKGQDSQGSNSRIIRIWRGRVMGNKGIVSNITFKLTSGLFRGFVMT